jgi:hypothetical protein
MAAYPELRLGLRTRRDLELPDRDCGILRVVLGSSDRVRLVLRVAVRPRRRSNRPSESSPTPRTQAGRADLQSEAWTLSLVSEQLDAVPVCRPALSRLALQASAAAIPEAPTDITLEDFFSSLAKAHISHHEQ